MQLHKLAVKLLVLKESLAQPEANVVFHVARETQTRLMRSCWDTTHLRACNLSPKPEHNNSRHRVAWCRACLVVMFPPPSERHPYVSVCFLPLLLSPLFTRHCALPPAFVGLGSGAYSLLDADEEDFMETLLMET